MKLLSRILTFVLALPVPALAVADFSGHWYASAGTVSSNIPELSAKCSRVEMVIEQIRGTVFYAFNQKLSRDANGKPLLQSYCGTKNGIGAMATEAMHRKLPNP